ncbi:MAG: DUF2971 domain-containing protein [Clostridium neonatale]
MELKMGFNQFNNIVEKEGLDSAIKYKNEYIPKRLFQYNALLDKRYNNYIEKNEKRLESLKENKIYVTNYRCFNDPFEFEMLSVDMDKLQKENYDIKEIDKFLNAFKNKILVACFTTINDNMSMWAHYANNHKGYCVEYEITNTEKIYPVFYEQFRNNNSKELTNMVRELYDYYSNLNNHKEEFYKIFSYFYLSLCCKNKFWEYENEYRMLYKTDEIEVNTEKVIKIEDEDMNVKSIYIGYKCEDYYVNELINISKKIKCNVYKMDFNKYGVDYKLISKQI